MAGLWLVSLQGNVVVGMSGKTIVSLSDARVIFKCGSWVAADPLSGRVWGTFTGSGKLAIARGIACNPEICKDSVSFMSCPIKLSWAGKMEPSAQGPDHIDFFDQSHVEALSAAPLARVDFYGGGLFVLERTDNPSLSDLAFERAVDDLVEVL